MLSNGITLQKSTHPARKKNAKGESTAWMLKKRDITHINVNVGTDVA